MSRPVYVSSYGTLNNVTFQQLMAQGLGKLDQAQGDVHAGWVDNSSCMEEQGSLAGLVGMHMEVSLDCSTSGGRGFVESDCGRQHSASLPLATWSSNDARASCDC